MEQYVTRDNLADVLEKIGQRFDIMDQQLGRIEKNQESMIVSLSELSDAYREQQAQLRDHESRIDRLERGGWNYYMDIHAH